MYMACPLQNLVREVGFGAALNPKSWAAVRQGLWELGLVWCQWMAAPVNAYNTDLS